jgi:energy-coupling factor transporter ATP-binding protein EcfA2
MQIIKSLTVENFAVFQTPLQWGNHASLNVIIGENDTGKTHLLKLLYALARTIEEYWKKQIGPQPLPLAELLSNKILWTFLPEKFLLGKLVSKSARGKLQAEMQWGEQGSLRFSFGKESSKKITDLDSCQLDELNGKRVSFLPPKEILSIFDAVIATREGAEIAAFDDTYYDLVQDFRQPTTSGALHGNIKQVFRHLEDVTGGGEVELGSDGIWFKRGKERFNMHQTAEGIKKIGILSRLMRNRRLTPTGGCILFVDEPEVNLHPRAIVLFADMLHEFAQAGIQVYLTTHSYFLLKRLEQLARKHQTDYSLLDLRKKDGTGVMGSLSRLKDGLPENPIIEQSLALFDADVELDLE